MTLIDQSLVKKLALFLVIKLVLLLGLWWHFIKDSRVQTDEKSVASHLMTQPLQKAQESKP